MRQGAAVRVYASGCSLSHASGRRQVCVRVQLVSKGQRPDAVKCGATWGRRQHSQERLKSEGTQAPAAASGRKVSARRKMRGDTGTQGYAPYLLVVRVQGLANSKVPPGNTLERLAAHHGHKHWST